jgi:hypothetical protein
MLICCRGKYLLSRYPETNICSESFANNGSFSGSAALALSKYATIYRIDMVAGICEVDNEI